MTAMRKILAALALAVGLAGCVMPPAPETPRERLAAVEYGYMAALGTVHRLVTIGAIDRDTAPPILDGIAAVDLALDAAHNAVKAGDDAALATAVAAADRALLRLIAHLEDIDDGTERDRRNQDPVGSTRPGGRSWQSGFGHERPLGRGA